MSTDLDALQSITAAYDKQELDRLHSLWKKARKDSHRKQQELEQIKRHREVSCPCCPRATCIPCPYHGDAFCTQW